MVIDNIDISKTCCFSGYRPHKFSFELSNNNQEFSKLESNIMVELLKSYDEGYDTFLCGGAMGFDIICGEMVLLCKERFKNIRLIGVFPFKNQHRSFTNNWNERYHSLVKNCDAVYYASEEYTTGCYMERNNIMVDNSSRVITYFDGQSGGTARTLAYAQLKKREIVNVCKEIEVPKNLHFFIERG